MAERAVRPSVQSLLQYNESSPIACPVCARGFANGGLLRLHTVKVHKIARDHADACLLKSGKNRPIRARYHCPQADCAYNDWRSFAKFSQLKQHYIRVHGAREHACAACGVRFALARDLRYHCANQCGANNTNNITGGRTRHKAVDKDKAAELPVTAVIIRIPPKPKAPCVTHRKPNRSAVAIRPRPTVVKVNVAQPMQSAPSAPGVVPHAMRATTASSASVACQTYEEAVVGSSDLSYQYSASSMAPPPLHDPTLAAASQQYASVSTSTQFVADASWPVQQQHDAFDMAAAASDSDILYWRPQHNASSQVDIAADAVPFLVPQPIQSGRSTQTDLEFEAMLRHMETQTHPWADVDAEHETMAHALTQTSLIEFIETGFSDADTQT